MPAASSVAAALTLVPLLAVAVIAVKTVCGSPSVLQGRAVCYVKFGTAAFVLSGLMLIAEACPQISRVIGFTWFGPAQTQLQILGFFTVVMCGAIYELLPRVMGFGLPFPEIRPRSSTGCSCSALSFGPARWPSAGWSRG